MAAIVPLLTQQALAAPDQNLLTGTESTYCQQKGMSESKNFDSYISCMQSEEDKSKKLLNATFNKALSNVQSENWLLPNVNYESEKSKITSKNKFDLQDDQNHWLKHKSEFCNVLTSKISDSAKMYSVLLMQCHINMDKQRAKELNYLLNNN